MTRSSVWAIGIAVLALYVAPAAAHAAWPASPLVNVPVCTAAGNQSVSSVVADGLGGMIIAWSDTRSGDSDIYAQSLDGAGFPRWSANGIAVNVAPGDQINPRAISDGAGGAIVVWQDSGNGSITDVYAQRIDVTGAKRWPAAAVAVCTLAGQQVLPQAITDGAGGVVVAWSDHRAAAYWNFYAQRLDADGVAQWPADGVGLTSTLVEHQPPQIAADATGGLIATWHAPGGTSVHPWAQRLDGSGARLWGANGVMLASISTQVDPVIVSDAAGGAIIAWADYRDGNALTTATYAQRIDATGIPLWQANGVALSTAKGTQIYQAIVTDGAGGAVVVWSNDSTTAIMANRVSASGSRMWLPAGAVVCAATGTRWPNRIASDGAGGVIVPWMDALGDGGDIDVQQMNASGAPVWNINAVAVCTASAVQAGPIAVSDAAGGALIAWSDARSGSGWDAYAQNVRASGALGGTTLSADAAGAPVGLSIRCLGENPVRGVIRLECSLPENGHAQARLFDLSGRCVETQDLKRAGAGRQVIEFSRSRAARVPGIYFVSLMQGERFTVTRLVSVR